VACDLSLARPTVYSAALQVVQEVHSHATGGAAGRYSGRVLLVTGVGRALLTGAGAAGGGGTEVRFVRAAHERRADTCLLRFAPIGGYF
jgi:hypothetical protein